MALAAKARSFAAGGCCLVAGTAAVEEMCKTGSVAAGG